MDPEEERVLYLTRVGRETIIKRGTYDVRNARPIMQNHPFYEYKSLEEGEAYLKSITSKNMDDDDESSKDMPLDLAADVSPDLSLDTSSDSSSGMSSDLSSQEIAGNASDYGMQEENSVPEEQNQDPDSLANEIISSNFKVGMSQSEVDEFLKGLLGN